MMSEPSELLIQLKIQPVDLFLMCGCSRSRIVPINELHVVFGLGFFRFQQFFLRTHAVELVGLPLLEDEW